MTGAGVFVGNGVAVAVAVGVGVKVIVAVAVGVTVAVAVGVKVIVGVGVSVANHPLTVWPTSQALMNRTSEQAREIIAILNTGNLLFTISFFRYLSTRGSTFLHDSSAVACS
jgi:hypothetical protein